MERNFASILLVAIMVVSQIGYATAVSDSAALQVAQEGQTCAGIANIQCAPGLVCTGVAAYPDAGGKCAKPSTNKPPVIQSVSAPSQLAVGETGTWSVSAYDPEGKQLTYYATWGDEPAYSNGNPTGTASVEVSQTSTFTHIYYNAGSYNPTFKVVDDQGASAQATATVAVSQSCPVVLVRCAHGYETYSYTDANGCTVNACRQTSKCPDARPACQSGYEQTSYVDSNGCTVYQCKSASTPKVDVSVGVEPTEVKLYNSFLVSGKITYVASPMPTADSASNQKKFKVVTSFSDSMYLKGASQKTMLAAKEESVLDRVINTIMGTPNSASTAATKVPNSAEPSQTASIAPEPATPQQATQAAPSQPIAPQATSVAAVATAPSKTSNAQERVDYITLGPGETTSVSAYFTPNTPGTKFAKVSVYYTDYQCPANSQMGMPCSEKEILVGQSSAKVDVASDSAPPLPPQEDAVGTIALYSGWNMVSIPVGAKVPMSDMAAQCGTPAYAWQLSENGYARADTLEPGYGYWVKGSRDCKYPVRASAYTLDVAPLFSGWNLVAAPGNSVQASDFSGTCQITSGPWYYSHDASATSQYVYSASLVPGSAYWIKVASSCRLSGSNIDQPPAPPASQSVNAQVPQPSAQPTATSQTPTSSRTAGSTGSVPNTQQQ